MVCSGLYLVAALLSLTIREIKSESAPSAPELSTRSLTKGASALPVLFLLGVLFWTAAHSASASMWPNYMKTLGYSKTASGALWGMAAAIEFPAMVVAGSLSDAIGRTPLLIAGGSFISLTNLGYVLLAGVFPALLCIQVLRGFGFGSYTTTAMTFATERSEQQQRGSKSGIFNTMGNAGSMLGTFLGGTLVQAFNFQVMYGVCAGLALTAALCFLVLRYRDRKQAAVALST